MTSPAASKSLETLTKASSVRPCPAALRTGPFWNAGRSRVAVSSGALDRDRPAAGSCRNQVASDELARQFRVFALPDWVRGGYGLSQKRDPAMGRRPVVGGHAADQPHDAREVVPPAGPGRRSACGDDALPATSLWATSGERASGRSVAGPTMSRGAPSANAPGSRPPERVAQPVRVSLTNSTRTTVVAKASVSPTPAPERSWKRTAPPVSEGERKAISPWNGPGWPVAVTNPLPRD